MGEWVSGRMGEWASEWMGECHKVAKQNSPGLKPGFSPGLAFEKIALKGRPKVDSVRA